MAQQDACTLLDDDHNQVERLFEQYKSAPDESSKRMLAQQVCQELAVHTQIEEEIFYPAYRQATRDEALVDESEHEHQEARDLILKIEQVGVDDKLMRQLEEAVLHHVTDERKKMFPEARKTQGLDLMQLAQQLESRKAELMAAHAA